MFSENKNVFQVFTWFVSWVCSERFTYQCMLRQELDTNSSEWKEAHWLNFQLSVQNVMEESHRQPAANPSDGTEKSTWVTIFIWRGGPVDLLSPFKDTRAKGHRQPFRCCQWCTVTHLCGHMILRRCVVAQMQLGWPCLSTSLRLKSVSVSNRLLDWVLTWELRKTQVPELKIPGRLSAGQTLCSSEEGF